MSLDAPTQPTGLRNSPHPRPQFEGCRSFWLQHWEDESPAPHHGWNSCSSNDRHVFAPVIPTAPFGPQPQACAARSCCPKQPGYVELSVLRYHTDPQSVRRIPVNLRIFSDAQLGLIVPDLPCQLDYVLSRGIATTMPRPYHLSNRLSIACTKS